MSQTRSMLMCGFTGGFWLLKNGPCTVVTEILAMRCEHARHQRPDHPQPASHSAGRFNIRYIKSIKINDLIDGCDLLLYGFTTMLGDAVSAVQFKEKKLVFYLVRVVWLRV